MPDDKFGRLSDSSVYLTVLGQNHIWLPFNLLGHDCQTTPLIF